jgi:ABC-type transporter Mla subunit MlaD
VAKISRVPAAVGAIPVVGDLVKQADSQAQWLQELIEQNARLVGQLPATMKNFNDTLERFNQTVSRLDRVVTSIEGATSQLVGPLEQLAPRLERLAGAVDPRMLREIPDVLDAVRREALPALRAATDTQKQVALIAATLDRVIAVLNELPGAGLVRRLGGMDRRAEGGPRPEPAAQPDPLAQPGPTGPAGPSSPVGPSSPAGPGGHTPSAAGPGRARSSGSSARGAADADGEAG